MANTFLIMHILFCIITYIEFNELIRINQHKTWCHNQFGFNFLGTTDNRLSQTPDQEAHPITAAFDPLYSSPRHFPHRQKQKRRAPGLRA